MTMSNIVDTAEISNPFSTLSERRKEFIRKTQSIKEKINKIEGNKSNDMVEKVTKILPPYPVPKDYNIPRREDS